MRDLEGQYVRAIREALYGGVLARVEAAARRRQGTSLQDLYDDHCPFWAQYVDRARRRVGREGGVPPPR